MKSYIAIMSNGPKIKVDTDEVPTVLSGISARIPIRVRQGIINSVHLVSLVEDEVRNKENQGRTVIDPSEPNGTKVIEPAFKKLPDIFEGIPLPGDGNKLSTSEESQ